MNFQSTQSQQPTQELVTIDIEKKKNEIVTKVQNSHEVQAIIQQIDLENTNSLMTFGSHSAEEISKFSDMILRSMKRTQSEDAGELIVHLNKIMDRFDIEDFENQKEPTLLAKWFNKAKNSIEAIYKKYETMEDEVNKVNVTLRQYEHDITKENDQLEEMFHNNLAYYEDLQRYIVAGEMAIQEIMTKLIPEWEQKALQSGNQLDQLNVEKLYQGKTMMEQRVYDLRLAENIALQSMPMIRATQLGNYELVRKINSSFIITLPLFKQALAQTILLKRQAVRTKATKALDEKTNELLKRNAQNTVLQAKTIAELTSGSFVQIETLEQTWTTIMQGIEGVKQIYADASVKREQDTKKLEEFKRTYEGQKFLPHNK
jgi:uncharacterized protein YaaN involved in tellurite resistance